MFFVKDFVSCSNKSTSLKDLAYILAATGDVCKDTVKTRILKTNIIIGETAFPADHADRLADVTFFYVLQTAKEIIWTLLK